MEENDDNLTDVIITKVARLEYIKDTPFALAHTVCEKQVIVPRSAYEEGERVIFVPNGSCLPDEPEFSGLGAQRKCVKGKRVPGYVADGLFVSLADAASIMSRRAFEMAQTDEERELLGRKDRDYLFDAANAAIREIPMGVDIGTSLGIVKAMPEGSPRPEPVEE